MSNSIGSVNGHGRMHYVNQARRAAWREEMLAQMLAKVREVGPVEDRNSLAVMNEQPRKGALLDVFI